MTRSLIVSTILLLTTLALSITPATAVGGWETIHILMNRIGGERAEHQIITSGESNNSRISKQQTTSGGTSNKAASKKHDDVVITTSSSKSKRSRRGSSNGKNCEEDDATPTAFVTKGRRRGGAGICSDVEDANAIEFVRRSNPFL